MARRRAGASEHKVGSIKLFGRVAEPPEQIFSTALTSPQLSVYVLFATEILWKQRPLFAFLTREVIHELSKGDRSMSKMMRLMLLASTAGLLLTGSCLTDNFWADKWSEIVNRSIFGIINAALANTPIGAI
jgi:hypothetical protein